MILKHDEGYEVRLKKISLPQITKCFLNYYFEGLPLKNKTVDQFHVLDKKENSTGSNTKEGQI